MPIVDRQNRIKNLFSDALELAPAMRDSFLESATGDDLSIRTEVRQLIAAHERAERFIVDPTIDASAVDGPIGQNIGRYTLLRLIGEGGFGSVYLARQREPIERIVALKVIKPGMDTRQVIARFEAERQTLAMMKHPGIAAVFDAGTTREARPYFVMEYVDGLPITEYCDQHNFTIEQRLKLFIDVCGAVQHAHTKGVIHRDLKPSNILVTNEVTGVRCQVSGEGGTSSRPNPGIWHLTPDTCVKIIDFGIAKATSARLSDITLTADGRGFIGTPQYISPEHAGLDAIDTDTRSDVYSLGVVLYELLAGALPFDEQRLRSAGPGGWQRIVREEEPPKPSARVFLPDTSERVAAQRGIEAKRLSARLRGDLDRITLKALEKDRERRYGSAAELAEDLRRHLDHKPVRASPPNRMYRVKKFVRRHRMGMAATTVAALALISGAAGLVYGMVQARSSAQEAGDAAQQALAVNDFMQEILTSVSPDVDGADVRLVEVMDDASAAASQRFAGHPMLEAEIRDLLGHVYNDLSMHNKAKIEFRRAMELWQEHAGPDDRRSLTSEHLYVGSALNNQQVTEIELRLPALAARTERVFGSNHLAALDVRRSIGLSHMMRGRIDQAERIFLDVRAQVRAQGDDDALQIRTLRSLIRIGRMRSSGAAYETRAAIAAEIEPLAKEMADRAVSAYGPASLVALDARVKWAEVLADQREYPAAVHVCRDVLETASNRLGECHFIRLEALEVLAEASHRTGDSPAAAAMELMRINCVRQERDVIELIVSISDALPILDRGQRWVEGEALSREYIEQLNAMGGGHGDMLLEAELWVARFVSLQGRLDEADAMFQSLLTGAETVEPAANVRARVHLFHGSNLCRLGAFEEAQAQIQTAADTMSDFRMGTLNTNPDDILVEFIDLSYAWGKPEMAAEYEAMREQTLANLPIDPS